MKHRSWFQRTFTKRNEPTIPQFLSIEGAVNGANLVGAQRAAEEIQAEQAVITDALSTAIRLLNGNPAEARPQIAMLMKVVQRMPGVQARRHGLATMSAKAHLRAELEAQLADTEPAEPPTA